MIAQTKQHARTRRRILELADAAKASGGIRGRVAMDILEQFPGSPADDAELLGLCQDLVNAGLLTVTDQRRYTRETFGLDYALYAITAPGTALLAEAVPPHPLVADDRIH